MEMSSGLLLLRLIPLRSAARVASRAGYYRDILDDSCECAPSVAGLYSFSNRLQSSCSSFLLVFYDADLNDLPPCTTAVSVCCRLP